jgi:acetoin utilization protein AcuC
MALSNVGLWSAVEKLLRLCERTVVLGGGGYNPWTVVRCWGGLWGRLSGRDIPADLPPDTRRFLGGFECDLIDEDEVPEAWVNTLADEPNIGPVRPEIERLADLVLN